MIDVRDNADLQRYEASEDEQLEGLVEYRDRDRPDGTVRTLVHTETLPGFEGRGVASALARGSLDDVRRRGMTIIPACPFIAAYIRSHHEYDDLVAHWPRGS